MLGEIGVFSGCAHRKFAEEVRTVAPLFAEAIRRIHIGESVSSLFGPVPCR